MEELQLTIEVVLIKLQSVVVKDGNEVCGTYNRK